MSYLTAEQRMRFAAIRKAMDKFIEKVVDSTTEINDNVMAIRAWVPGKYDMNDVRVYENIPYKCVQAHDSTANESWTPAATPALWMQYHGTEKDYARPWIQPTGTHDMYKIGEYMIWTDGNIYKCISDTTYSPIEYSTAWIKDDEEESFKVQNWTSGNSYMTGDHVLYENIEYESAIDNNIWSPADYPAGWAEVTE